jgi:hypothetical protein
VTDAGLDQLKGLKHLRNLYVWQTKVTDSGVKKIKAALPNLDVSTGWDLTVLAKKEDKKDEKQADKKSEKKDTKKADEKDPKKDDKTAEKKEEKK